MDLPLPRGAGRAVAAPQPLSAAMRTARVAQPVRRPRLPTPAFGAVAGVIKHKSSRLRARLRSSASSSKSGAGTPGAQTIAELSEQPVADAAGWESDESGL